MAAGNRQCTVYAVRATTKVATGFCLSKNVESRRGPHLAVHAASFWLKDASARHARGLAVSGLTRLQRVCFWEQCLERLPKGSGSRPGCFQRFSGFLDGLCRKGFLETNHPLDFGMEARGKAGDCYNSLTSENRFNHVD